MKTALAVLLSLAVGTAIAAQPPRCPGGRFLVDGDPLDLGAPADRIEAVEVGIDDPPSVRVDGPCASADGIRVLRPRATIVRALLEGCGDAARTRLRIRLPRGCDGATVRVRRAGVTIAERALRLDPASPAVSRGPRLTEFSPDQGVVGDVITVVGTDLDRDRSGALWQGSPPWHVRFEGPGLLPGPTGDAQFTVVSPTELRVAVPHVVFDGSGPAVGAAVVLSDDAGIVTAAPAPFFVAPRPEPPSHLRIENRSQYEIVSLRVDGVEKIADPGAVIGIGADLDLPPTGGAGAHLDVGYGVSFGAPLLTESFSVASDLFGANPVPLRPITIPQLLTDFDANAAHLHSWVSDSFHGTDGRDHVQTIAVSRDDTWALFADGAVAPTRSGTLALVSWPDDAVTVEFGLAAGLPTATIAAPFQSFTLGNLTFRAR